MTRKTALRFDRRRLLGGALASPIVAGLGAGTGTAQAKPGKALKLGLASYSLRKLPLERVIEVCKENQIAYLTAKDIHLPREEQALASALSAYKAAGIELLGGGVIYMKNEPEVVRADFTYAKAAGLPLIVAAPSPDSLDLVEAMVKEFDIKVAIHNHGPEDKHYPAPADALKLIAKRDRRLGLCMDIGHTVRAGADPVRMVSVLGPRLFDLHVKDLKDKADKNSQTEVGKGVIDVAGLLKALRRSGFSGHVALEYEINADAPLPGIKESLAYMRGVVAGLSS